MPIFRLFPLDFFLFIQKYTYFCERMYYKFYLIMLLFCLSLPLSAQTKTDGKRPESVAPEDRTVDMDDPTFVPMVRVGKVLQGRDSIQYVELNNVYV